uniref:protein-glutamine gamma-glutamyltransferase n=1 Tax=Denticeps clupeoides TaxID=299321 RepID=A0AAY4ESZ8_9TELE
MLSEEQILTSVVFLVLAGDPSGTGGLHIEMPVTYSGHPSQPSWMAYIQPDGLAPTGTQSLSIYVCTSPTATVGVYQLHLNLLTLSGQRSVSIGQFLLVCNPWCPADSVYVPHEKLRDEYVKNDFGILYMGTPSNITFRPWSFDQYEPDVLETCMKLLQVSPLHRANWKKDYRLRADPVYISRVVSAMINCEDDKGVLMGKWTDNFNGGINPNQWTGSGEILRLWAKSGFQPVKYGQCWVFAAVMCTVMRALGVPCRVVTNFNSAHDTNANLIIEEYYSEKGEKLHQSSDSIWNFHVWVECWMKRPDLAVGFDGWQVLDPTPQERSEGVFCCGPAPVKAIRECCFSMFYDIPFVYAEVNAEVHTFIVKDHQLHRSKVEKDRVGSLICTKGLGSCMYQNITAEYKSNKACMSPGSNIRKFSEGLSVSLKIHTSPVAGESITFTITVTNQDSCMKTLKEHVNAQAKQYHSSPMHTIWDEHRIVTIAPCQTVEIPHSIPRQALLCEDLINLAVVVEDAATQKRVLACEEFSISRPTVSIRVQNENDVAINQEGYVTVSFRNPFPEPVSGELTITASGLLENKVQARVLLLQPGAAVERKITFTATTPGIKTLHAVLVLKNCPAVIRGFKNFRVNGV